MLKKVNGYCQFGFNKTALKFLFSNKPGLNEQFKRKMIKEVVGDKFNLSE